VARTKDGFELTVGTNHLGHFYLNSLLLPQLKSDGRIVVTASSLHDPDSPGGAQGKTATLGDLTGFERDGKFFEMVDGEPFNADKAYKDSKVCVVEFTGIVLVLHIYHTSFVLVLIRSFPSCATFSSFENCSVDWNRRLRHKAS
jgi:hypothetical protein